MKIIDELVAEFKQTVSEKFTQPERSAKIKSYVETFGIEKVSQATGYKISTLIAISNDRAGTVLISDLRVIQAEYVFNKFNIE